MLYRGLDEDVEVVGPLTEHHETSAAGNDTRRVAGQLLQYVLLGGKHRLVVEFHLGLHGQVGAVDKRVVVIVDVVPPRLFLGLDLLDALDGESKLLGEPIDNGLVEVLDIQLLGQFASYGTSTRTYFAVDGNNKLFVLIHNLNIFGFWLQKYKNNLK